MKVWISRDKTKSGAIEMYDEKPAIDSRGWWKPLDYDDQEHRLRIFTQKEFKAFFGFTPRKGTCKQYELTLKEL